MMKWSGRKSLLLSKNTTEKELETLTDVLQFCDLVSLYICCGAQNAVEFPSAVERKSAMKVEGAIIAPTLLWSRGGQNSRWLHFIIPPPNRFPGRRL